MRPGRQINQRRYRYQTHHREADRRTLCDPRGFPTVFRQCPVKESRRQNPAGDCRAHDVVRHFGFGAGEENHHHDRPDDAEDIGACQIAPGFPRRDGGLRQQQAPRQKHSHHNDAVKIKRLGPVKLRRREAMERFLHQPVMWKIRVNQRKPDEPRQHHAEEHQPVERREKSFPDSAPPQHAVEHQQHQNWNQKSDRPFHQRRKTGGSRAKEIPVATRASIRFLREIAGENGRHHEKAKRDVKYHRPRVHQKQRSGRQHDCGKGGAADSVFAPAEKVNQRQQPDAKCGGGDARGGFRIAEHRQREGDRLEVKGRFVQIRDAVVSGHQPRARRLHLARHLRVSALVRLLQRQSAQSKTDGNPRHSQNE